MKNDDSKNSIKNEPNSTGVNINFVKNLQLTTIHYALLLYFGIIIYFKLPGELIKDELIKMLFIWLTRSITVFASFYQIHTSVSLWIYRKKAKINYDYQKVLWFVYLIFFLTILLITHVITCRIIAIQTNGLEYLLFKYL